MTPKTLWRAVALLLLSASFATGCGAGGEDTLTVYSGRTDTLVGPLLDQFSKDTGIKIQVRYASTSGIVALLLEEGKNSPADIAFLQDSGALGALAKAGMLESLPDDILARVDPRFRSREGLWVGASGRVRTVVYNVYAVDPETDLPDSILGFTDPRWKGRIGWAPTNGSFQAFVTALRIVEGDAAARDWLEGIEANAAVAYANNIAIVDAVARGEVDVGFVNHYYLFQFLQEHGPGFAARNHYYPGDIGGLINVAGGGVLGTTDSRENARRFIEYLLSEEAQAYFAEETNEYPLIDGVDPVGELPPISELDPPDVDLSNLDDLRGTLDLMREVGILP